LASTPTRSPATTGHGRSPERSGRPAGGIPRRDCPRLRQASDVEHASPHRHRTRQLCADAVADRMCPSHCDEAKFLPSILADTRGLVALLFEPLGRTPDCGPCGERLCQASQSCGPRGDLLERRRFHWRVFRRGPRSAANLALSRLSRVLRRGR
jgi:hypothetical protein